MKLFRRILLLLLAATFVLSACGGTGENTPATTESKATETTEITEATQMKNIYQKADPAQDDTLNLLMIGSSFCYYYVEELYGMLEAAGIKANVCNVYYSGCPLEKHWQWWKTGEANYDYYITNEEGRKGTKSVNLEWCLQQQNWDMITLQENTTKIYTAGAETHFGNTRQMLTELWGYIKEQFPMSRYGWHQTWARPVGVAFNGTVTGSVAEQTMFAGHVEEYARTVCREFALERVPSGAAWQVVRDEYQYDNFCARIGKADANGNPHGGDGSHDGDWGGGQYLNACVWFEILTGESCIGNTYRPVYMAGDEDLSLSEDMIKMFQESAHKAVEQMTP